uniref:Fructose-bisphosphate aldolase n=1 Tax=Arcella intermedia TaxID=1963864 RepID=A0A6B2L8G1_9EUKA
MAADESTGTIQKRFDSIKLENTEENRRTYRELLFSTPGIGTYISGAILYEETLYQSTKDGKPFPKLLQEQGVLVGIKVDKGLKYLPGTDNEMACQGLTDLDVRCKKYYEAGARFAKWRAAYTIAPGKPSELLVKEQAWGLARYAAICQANGLVPIVEPEVMMDGPHDIEHCARISEHVFATVVKALHDNGVLLEGSLLKPNMILQGSENSKKATPHEVASYTLRTLKRTIPSSIPGVMFLSGGQTEEEATVNLDALNRLAGLPWTLSFSYGRALQASCLKAWGGKAENFVAGQNALLERAKANSEAQLGKYAGGSGGASASVSLFEKNYVY